MPSKTRVLEKIHPRMVRIIHEKSPVDFEQFTNCSVPNFFSARLFHESADTRTYCINTADTERCP